MYWGGQGAALPVYGSPNVFFFEPEIASFNEIANLMPHNSKVADFTADIAVAVKDAQLSFPI